MIIDAENLLVGKFATVAAKKALLGEEVFIINCDKACISGKKKSLLASYKRKREMGTHKGPSFPKISNMIVKRMIRGMLPYKQARGSDAFKRIKCYVGVPAKFEGKEFEKLTIKASVEKLPGLNYITIKEISSFLGGKS